MGFSWPRCFRMLLCPHKGYLLKLIHSTVNTVFSVKTISTGCPDWLYGAIQPTDTYTVCKDGVTDTGSLLHRRYVVIDQYSGKILDVDDPSKGTVGEVFTQWQWPLHFGQAFSWTGRILVFLSGLACPLLFVTGVIRWLQKRRVQKIRFDKWFKRDKKL